MHHAQWLVMISLATFRGSSPRLRALRAVNAQGSTYLRKENTMSNFGLNVIEKMTHAGNVEGMLANAMLPKTDEELEAELNAVNDYEAENKKFAADIAEIEAREDL